MKRLGNAVDRLLINRDNNGLCLYINEKGILCNPL